jgi:hypothetical protein
LIPPLWRNSWHSFSLTSRDCRKTSFQIMYFDHIEVMVRHCILHRLCPIFWFECEDITMIRSRLFNKQTQVLWERGSGKREITQENLQLPWSLSVASVSIWCALGRHAVYCKSCWWVNRNCGCTQTRSSNLLLVELPLLQLLLLLWSRKELDLGHSNCACYTDDEEDMKKTLLLRKTPWQFLSLLTIQEHPK